MCSSKYWYSTWNFCIKRLVLLFSNFSSSYTTYNNIKFIKIYVNIIMKYNPRNWYFISRYYMNFITHLLFGIIRPLIQHSTSCAYKKQKKINQNPFECLDFRPNFNRSTNKNYSKINEWYFGYFWMIRATVLSISHERFH